MEDIYTEIVEALSRKETLALATLVNRLGSAPRAAGAKYLIKEDGTSLGSIGGGCVEAEVWQEARKVVEKKRGSLLKFELTAEQMAEGGLICGGNIDVFIEPLREEFLNIYREVVRIKRKGGFAILATIMFVNNDPPKIEDSKILMRPSGEKVGSLFDGEILERRILGETEALSKEKKPKILVLSSDRNDSLWQRMEILLEPVFSEPVVYIFGAGHISQQVALFAKRVHFKVIVIDDREVFANKERFPDADQVIVSEFKKCFEQFNIDDSSYIVIVTRGHLYDGFVLDQAIKTNARYIGMIGSKKKIQILYRNLMEKGVPIEAINRVCAPIGIDIHSETPEEIAVSIVAELIKVRGEPKRF